MTRWAPRQFADRTRHVRLVGETGRFGNMGERRRGIARVPYGPERIDEADAAGKVECDELRHRPVA